MINKIRKIKYKKLICLLPVYIIPVINIVLVCFNYETSCKIIVSICSILSSTAASAACTSTYYISREKYKTHFYIQMISICVSIVCFILCLVYEFTGVLILPLWLLTPISIFSIVLVSILIITSVEEINKILDDNREEIHDLIIRGKNNGNTKFNENEYNLKRKGDK